jgi:hypothetical protein
METTILNYIIPILTINYTNYAILYGNDFKLKVTDPETYLGMEIHRSEGRISLSQKSYIMSVLERYRMSESNPVGTPSCTKYEDTMEEDKPLSKGVPFRDAVGSLMYIKPRLHWQQNMFINSVSEQCSSTRKITTFNNVSKQCFGTEMLCLSTCFLFPVGSGKQETLFINNVYKHCWQQNIVYKQCFVASVNAA